MSDPAPDRRADAARLFRQFLDGAQDRQQETFARLCADHPDLAAELRGLHERWQVAARLLAADPDTRPVPERLAHAYGPGVDPGVALDRGAGADAGAGAAAAGRPIPGLRRLHYRSHGQLARGGMGEILRIYDPELRRQVAMKTIASPDGAVADDTRGRRLLARFLEEAQITGQLVHPGIVPVHELGLDAEGRVFFTMQLVQGSTFEEVIALARAGDDGWSIPRAIGVLLKVCEAVAYAHSRGVVHRDLKPRNVMVGRFGETYVMDWGLAHVLGSKETKDIRLRQGVAESVSIVATGRRDWQDATPDSPLLTVDGDVVGTPAFMPPEQAAGDLERLGPRSDVYSLGAMLYQTLTGWAPYSMPGEVRPPLVTLQLLRDGPPTGVLRLDPSAAPELVAVCEKAMARSSDDRYASALEMARDLEAYLGRRPVSPLQSSPIYVLRLAFVRNRTLVLTVAAALLLVIGLLTTDVVQVRAARRVSERLLDFAAAEVLLDRAGSLFPPTPEVAPALAAWLAEADRRTARLPEYQRESDRLAADATDAAAVELRAGIASLEALAVLRPEIEARYRRAATLVADSLDRHAAAWAAARDAIAVAPAYGGLRITPQVGLVPLGPNAQGYWQFWHVLSGARPTLGGDGVPQRDAAAGIVLVLLPGGTFDMGSPADEPGRASDENLRRFELAPLFVAECEVTQAQWRRAMGTDPSQYRTGTVLVETPSGGRRYVTITDLHPVESVNWHDCGACAHRLDLRLPTEAEWEYAARGGTRLPYGPVARPEGLAGLENVLDLSHTPTAVRQGGLAFDDGHPLHAPVGSFPPNGFGLRDVQGNVSEWCQDIYVSDDPIDREPWRRVFRGGNWYVPVHVLRVALRQYDNPRGLNQVRGLRLVRDLRP